MPLKNKLFLLIFTFFFFVNNSYSFPFKDFDVTFDYFHDVYGQISMVTEGSSVDQLNLQDKVYSIENDFYKVYYGNFEHNLFIKQFKITNTLYSFDLNNINSLNYKFLPINFSESFNSNWTIIEFNANKLNDGIDINHFTNYYDYLKLKLGFDSRYSYVPYTHLLSNNFSNLFLVNNDYTNKRSFIIYYNKSFIIHSFWLVFFFMFPFIVFISIKLGRERF